VARFRITSSGARRITSSGAERVLSGGSSAPATKPYSKWLCFHADEDNGVEDPALLTTIFAACNVTPADNAFRSIALFRHLNNSHYAEFLPQRAAAAAYNFDPLVILVPFTDDNPGDGSEEEADDVLAALEISIALYTAENPIFGFGNLTSKNFMPGATVAARRAAWFKLEARAIKIISDAGFRWCSTDDQGIVFLVTTIAERRAAWALEGIDPDACEFYCAHCYVDAGFVPAMYLLAEESLARLGITTRIAVTEGAFGFLGQGNTDIDKPWLLTEYAIGNPEGYPAHSLTWTRLLLAWFRMVGRYFFIFDWTRLQLAGVLSTWGVIFTEDQNLQPAFVEPPIGTLWFNRAKAPTRCYSLRLSNGGTVEEATAAAERVQAGYLFTIQKSGVSTVTAPRRPLADVRMTITEDGADLVLDGGDLQLEEGLRTAVVTSLFSDARALEEDPLPPEETSRRGFWADDSPDRFGSLLWLLQREKVTRATVERARQYARGALKWLVEEGIAERVEVEAEILASSAIGITIRLHRGRARRWSALWDATAKDLLASAQGVEVRILTA
jgi:phage gp46-like protein